ncbi:MAG: hypothetical protein Q8Q31_01205 [Nanoarchaeota archaeon]|nr:hypothetical protein [Nanoarchaeota archaeon]
MFYNILPDKADNKKNPLYFDYSSRWKYEVRGVDREGEEVDSPVEHVSASQMPEGVLGDYNLVTQRRRIVEGLSSSKTAFVDRHEYGHHIISRHFDSPDDEAKVDAYASARTGYVLRPFGIPEDVFRTRYKLN